MIQWCDEHIFEMGWDNQLVSFCLKISHGKKQPWMSRCIAYRKLWFSEMFHQSSRNPRDPLKEENDFPKYPGMS